MRLTFIRHREHLLETGEFLRVLVDGRDVTDHCYLADDEEGWAECYKVNKQRQHYCERLGEGPVRERLTGVIRFVPRKAADNELEAAERIARRLVRRAR